MNRRDYIRFLDSAMHSQRTAQSFHIGLTIGVVVLGVVAVGAAQLLSGILIPESVKWLLTLGGTFISTLSTVPLKQFHDRRTKIAALQFLADRFSQLQDDSASEEEASRLTDRFWKLMDASLGA